KLANANSKALYAILRQYIKFFALESEHSNLNLVKVLRSLPEQFNINVTVIKEDKDFDTMRIDDDEDSTSCSKFDEEHVSNYVAFTFMVNMVDFERQMLEKYNASCGKLNEILVARGWSPRKGGLGYVEWKGKVVAKGLTIFVKTTNDHHGESLNHSIMIKVDKKMEVSSANINAHWFQHSEEEVQSCLEKEGSK
ncbi:hypothetical protein Golax_001946, partial [Gossypium laxum]|nr:hypothetical protein [Gossypium laxum]